MKIRHFLYNAFLIEHKATKIAIDPGQNLWLFGFEVSSQRVSGETSHTYW